MLRYAVTATTVATSLLICAVPAPAKAPKDFVGVVAEDVFAGDQAYRNKTLAHQRRLGIQVIRQTFDWSLIERSAGNYDFSVYDAYMAAAARHRMRIVPVLFRPPSFRARAPHTDRATYPPKNFADMGTFGGQVARRYGPKGSFWRQNKRLPKVPIVSYQVWNEPNLPIYWPLQSSPRDYAALLRATSQGIKRVHSGANVMTAGMPESKMDGAIPLLNYVRGLYAGGAKASMDTVAINTYAESPKQLISLLRSVRKTMNRNGDRGAKIWVSEFGWADSGPASRFTVGARAQARNIAGSIAAMRKNRKKLGLTGFIYWNWRDAPPYRADFDFWGLHAGLLRQDDSRKPAYAAFARAVKKLK